MTSEIPKVSFRALKKVLDALKQASGVRILVSESSKNDANCIWLEISHIMSIYAPESRLMWPAFRTMNALGAITDKGPVNVEGMVIKLWN